MHPSAQRVFDATQAAGVNINIFEFPEGTRTAEDAAKAAGCDIGQIVKSLVFTVAGNPVMCLVSGANRMESKKLAALYEVGKKKVKRPGADVVKAATGYSIGGVNPYGLATDIDIWLDTDLQQYETVWVAAGTPNAIFEIETSALIASTGATPADIKQD